MNVADCCLAVRSQRHDVGREADHLEVVRRAMALVYQGDRHRSRVHGDPGRVEPVPVVDRDGDLLDAVDDCGGRRAHLRVAVDRRLGVGAADRDDCDRRDRDRPSHHGGTVPSAAVPPPQHRRERTGCAQPSHSRSQPPSRSSGVQQQGGEAPDEHPASLEARPEPAGRMADLEPVGRVGQLGDRHDGNPRHLVGVDRHPPDAGACHQPSTGVTTNPDGGMKIAGSVATISTVVGSRPTSSLASRRAAAAASASAGSTPPPGKAT